LEEIEKETGKKIYTILQLRLHPSIIALKKQVDEGPRDKIYDVDLTYMTSRGHWYHISWKGDVNKSGGIATNIGIHFFDMLDWVFGSVRKNTVHTLTDDSAAGFLELERARVRWFLSIDCNDIPAEIRAKGKRTYRSLTMEGQEIEFSDGFTDLHTASYQHIIDGKGFGLKEARTSIQTVYEIRNQSPAPLQGDYHPLAKNKK
jgi:UDP-N-acetyl-2-amino-2-deoxyglucuronate dehydrogenase